MTIQFLKPIVSSTIACFIITISSVFSACGAAEINPYQEQSSQLKSLTQDQFAEKTDAGRKPTRNAAHIRNPENKPGVHKITSRFKGKKLIIWTDSVRKNWEKKRFAKRIQHKKPNKPHAPGKIKLPFPAPPKIRANKKDSLSSFDLGSILETLARVILPGAAQANTLDQNSQIIVDGDSSDWSVDDHINLPLDLPPYLATGDELYGRYVATPEPAYIIALKSTGPALGFNTTFWLNTDQNPATGYQIFGSFGGAEYFVNIFSDSTLHLYDSNFNWVSGLNHAYSPDQRFLEIAIPAALLGSLTTPQSIDILGDINDTIFFPLDYTSGDQYTLPESAPVLPPRTDFSKRIGIVYGEATKNNFFGEKTYSQLFMALQHQAMMAGIAFDLLSENDLTDIANLVNYDALIFPFFSDVPAAIREDIHDTLYQAIYKYDIGIITADDWMTSDEAGNSQPGDAYRNMKQLLGIGRVNGEGPVNMNLTAQTVSHPAMKGYSANELIISYEENWYSYFQAVPGQPTESLAMQTVTGASAGTYSAVLASTTGGRNVHFATLGYMADTNLVWQALQWVIYGNDTPIGLKIGRANNLFVSRNDMDQSQFHDEVPIVHIPLYNLLQNWKRDYNFVGSYFINIGNDPGNGQWTDWNVSGPLFRDYIAMNNEIGTHSWTHPHFTDQLSASDIEFEFNQSMNEIGARLNPTWQNQNSRGGAVPGAPENLNTATQISQYLDYLSGGYSSFGAGYPSAIGYLTPNANKVYFSPNMTFDFTLIEFGVPVGNPPVPVPLTAEQAELYWQNEFNTLMSHASQPIIHWPWHDYGPTTSSDPVTGNGYTVAMFENTIAMANKAGSEFLTSADAAQRINTFKDAKLKVESANSVLTATVNANQLGKFSLAVNPPPGQVIQSVDNWYAYNDTHVFLDENGGVYNVQLGASAAPFSRIIALPMRSKLINLEGDGANLKFIFEGEGLIKVKLNQKPGNFVITSASSISALRDSGIDRDKDKDKDKDDNGDGYQDKGNNIVELFFDSFGTHTVSIMTR